MWLNNAWVSEYHRQGIGARIIERVVEQYGPVHASTNRNSKAVDDDFDTRYLTTEEASLVSSCIRQGIMRGNW